MKPFARLRGRLVRSPLLVAFRLCRTLPSALALLVAVGAFSACAKSKPEPGEARPAAASASVTVATPSATPPSAAAASAGAGPVGRAIVTIQDKLDSEKDGRPKDTPKVEDVFAAIEKTGAALTDKKQHVGSVYGAQYCMGAKSESVAYSACEYESADAAKAGRETSMKAFQTGNRDIFTNKKTTLTILQPSPKTPASEALAKKSVEAFTKL